MDIASAKEQIKNTVQIYLQKDSLGEYKIPVVNQRPVFVLGAPGLGKTAIMKQIADEMDLGFVSYSMTHHTRQSALGLPVIVEKEFDGTKYSVSEYTMSEIIASVYDCMEKEGKREGILFLDEINCVSETLSPSMLLFLQYKIFGGHQVPQGWVIVTAGNPPRFNKSVREFDAATRDRLKVIEVEPNYEAWKKYAIENHVNRAVVSYLDIRSDDFYRIETSVDGLAIVTPRAWEDLSEILQYHEELGLKVGYDLISQYIQNKQTARDFAVYYELYQKYRQVYQIEKILDGIWDEDTTNQAKSAKIDERMSLVSLLLEALFDSMDQCMLEHDALSLAVKKLKEKKAELLQIKEPVIGLSELENEWKTEVKNADKKAKRVFMQLLSTCEMWREDMTDGENAFAVVADCYKNTLGQLKKDVAATQNKIGSMLRFLEEAFNKGSELSMAVNDLTIAPEAVAFIGQFSSDDYFKISQKVLLHRQEKQLQKQIVSAGII